MALFFNLENLEKEADGNSEKFLALLEYHYRGSIPNSKHSRYKRSKLSLRGTSFVLNPGPIFDNDNTDPLYLVQYVKLCGRRDYGLYRLYGIKTLDLSFYPDLNLTQIKSNPLLKVVNKHIHFKFEEIYGTQVRRNQGQGS